MFDWTVVILIPAVIFALYAQIRVRTAFAKYSKVASLSGINGAEAARRILAAEGVQLTIEQTPGELTDHYDPRTRVLRLSPSVYTGRSLASLGVAAHETGHALQHHTNYLPLHFRNGIYPFVAFGQHIWYIIIIGSIFMMSSYAGWPPWMLDLGIMVLGGVVLFQLVTLPVEFNASKRALQLLTTRGIIETTEVKSTRAVLNAAALTYLAATLMAILQLVQLLMIRQRRN
jgi:hypothetical protein